MSRGFLKYFSILLVFLFGATGVVPVFSQTPGLSSAKNFKTSVRGESYSNDNTHVITRLPAPGSERKMHSLIASENELTEDSLTFKKAIGKWTSLGAAFALIFLPALKTRTAVFGSYRTLRDILLIKVYLLIRVFRI